MCVCTPPLVFYNVNAYLSSVADWALSEELNLSCTRLHSYMPLHDCSTLPFNPHNIHIRPVCNIQTFDLPLLFSVDESKLCDGLGPGFPVPVEITPFCHEHTLRTVAALPSCEGCKPVLRMGSSSSNVNDGDEIAVTDNGNYIVDLHFEEPIKDAVKMADEIKGTVGVVDHGLFCGMTTAVIIAGKDGISVKE